MVASRGDGTGPPGQMLALTLALTPERPSGAASVQVDEPGNVGCALQSAFFDMRLL
jgi:hypothetical protein